MKVSNLILSIFTAVLLVIGNNTQARFLTADPLGQRAGPNLYSYVYNNPIRWVDPLGLDVTVCLYPLHIGAGVNTGNTVGRRPANQSDIANAAFGRDVPGKVSSDTGEPLSCTTLDATAEQDRRFQDYIDEQTRNPGDYNLLRRSCVDFVRNPLRDILGLPLSNTNLPSPLYGSVFRYNNR